MAKFAKVVNGAIIGVGQVADTETITQNEAGEELHVREAVIPAGCVAVSDAEYDAIREDVPDASIIALIIERGSL